MDFASKAIARDSVNCGRKEGTFEILVSFEINLKNDWFQKKLVWQNTNNI